MVRGVGRHDIVYTQTSINLEGYLVCVKVCQVLSAKGIIVFVLLTDQS